MAVGFLSNLNFCGALNSELLPNTSLGKSTCTGPVLGDIAVLKASFKTFGISFASDTSNTFLETACIMLT